MSIQWEKVSSEQSENINSLSVIENVDDIHIVLMPYVAEVHKTLWLQCSLNQEYDWKWYWDEWPCCL